MGDITDSGTQYIVIKPTTLIDEVSLTEYYIGVSNNGNNPNSNIWQIKKIKKTGNVWNITLYPNGSQEFKFIWNNRTEYIYK